MEERFNKVKNIRFEIKDTFAKLTAKKDTVRGYYIQYIEKNKKNKMFGLDSFHFQSKLIDLEYKHLNEHYIFIDNRIYCDYYKLYNILITFFKQNFKTDFKHRSYPIYKDLEPFKQYDFDDINNIHYDIIEMIQHAYALISQNNDEIKNDQQKLKSGFNIDNYIHNNIYKNTLLSTNVNLFENYLHSYHIYHMNFLKNLLDKLGLFQTQLANNVRTDGVSPTYSEPSTPSSRSLDRVISLDDDEDINIVIDRSIPRQSVNKQEVIEEPKPIEKEVIEEPKPIEKEVIEEPKPIEKEVIEEPKPIEKEVIEEPKEEVIAEPKTEVIEEPKTEVIEEPKTEVIAEPKEEVTEVIAEPKEEVTEVIAEPKEEVPEEPNTEVIEEPEPIEESEVIEETKIIEKEVIAETKEEEPNYKKEVLIIQNNTRGVEPNDVKSTNKKKKKRR
jgi:hypothetical protein